VKMLRSAIRKNVSIELDLKYDTPEILADSSQIQQIVMNLIINAAEAIANQEGTVKITLSKSTVQANDQIVDYWGGQIPAGTYACLTVSDNGCGMDVETQRRMFEPFFTTKFTGRGLGMSAALGIIKLHDGFLQLTSNPGVGSLFKVYFPSAASMEYGALPTEDDQLYSVNNNATILIVEDEAALLKIGCSMLQTLGFTAIPATNGKEALEVYRDHGSEISLILLDMIMPKMDGVTTYRKLREISRSIPIVLSSGYSFDEIIDEVENDPYAAVIQKPYKPSTLKETIKSLLDPVEK